MASSTKHGDTSQVAKAIAQDLAAENTPDSPVVASLRRQVANGFVLYANYKHYHWQTYGPLFRDLHKLFDKCAEAVLESIDEFAERVRMIGQDPPAHPIEMMDLASVSAAAAHLSPHDMVQEAERNELIVIKEMRQAAKIADQHDDPGTVDLFSRMVQVHEKHEWFLRDILRKRDGLTS
jgi:starvation-inducible DNA-binding protein